MSADYSGPLGALVAALFGGGAVGAVLAYVRDRRKARVEGYVAVETKELQVDAVRFAELERRLELVSNAFDKERASKDRLIADLTTDNRRMHDELAEKNAELAELRAELEQMQRQLDAMRERVERVLPHDPPTD